MFLIFVSAGFRTAIATCRSLPENPALGHEILGEWRTQGLREGNTWNISAEFSSPDLAEPFGVNKIVVSFTDPVAANDTRSSFSLGPVSAREVVLAESDLGLASRGQEGDSCAPEALPNYSWGRTTTTKPDGSPLYTQADPINIVYKGEYQLFRDRLLEVDWTDVGWAGDRCGEHQYVPFHNPGETAEVMRIDNDQLEDVEFGCTSGRAHVRLWNLQLLDGTSWTVGAVHREHSHWSSWREKHFVHSFEDPERQIGGNFCGATAYFRVEFGSYELENVEERLDHDNNLYTNSGWALYVGPGQGCIDVGF